MPRATPRKRPVRAPSDTPDAVKRNLEKHGHTYLSGKLVENAGKSLPSFEGSAWAMRSSVVPKRILDSKSGKRKVDGELSHPLNVASASLSLKSAGTMAKLKCHGASMMESKAHSTMVTKTLVQEQRATSEFLTLRYDKGRMIRSKATPLQAGRRILRDTGRASHVSHAQMLRLFQALGREPLSFLELRGRFGVSKQTIKRLVRNRLLTETWGPDEVGVRFTPSDKGEAYLKAFEAAAKYEPTSRKNVIIKLRQTTAV